MSGPRPQPLSAPQLADTALAASRADGCLVLITETSEVNLRFANNTMTTNGHATSRGYTVISVVGEAVGVISSSAADPDGVAAAVAASETAAAQSGPAQDVAALVAGSADDGFAEPAAVNSIDVFARLAAQLTDALDAARGAGQLLYGYAEHRLTTTWLASSTGLRRRWTQPTGSIDINAKVAADRSRSAWTGQYTADFADVELAAMIGELSTRLGWAQRTVELPAGRYETILPPSATADLMIYLAASMDGRPAHEGRSAFSAPGGTNGTRVGERLTDLPLTIASDPAEPGLHSEPFLITTASTDSVSVFDNGARLERVEWVRDGTINALAYPRAAADELDASFTPPVGNLVLTGGNACSTSDMVAGTERGLLLTCLWYIREVDPASLLQTGLTRDGVYLVERGEVVGQVNNFRFNESPLDLVRRCSEVGATERTLCRELKEWFPRTAMPPMRVPDFNMSSISRGF